MAVNLLHHLFQTKIECSAVSLDGYSPQNLISESWRDRNCGFLAAHFIKPPVCLLVQLPFPINVHSLVIKPKVGSQISSGIDVFVAGIKHDSLGETAVVKDIKVRQGTPSSPGPSSNKPRAKRPKVETGLTHTGRQAQELISRDAEDFAHKYSTLITPHSFRNEHRNIFTLVGRVNELLGTTIKMINKRYGGKIDPACDSSGDATIHEFFQCRSLNYVTHLVVVVSRVKGSCVPAVGRLEIWGQPSSCCGALIMSYVSDIQEKISQQVNESAASIVTKNGSNGSTNGNIDRDNKKERCLEDEKIPPEFIDPITCSLMTIPMLLPSGLNIDLSTLEKHIEAERSWGRLPSDPFTGVLFSDEVKPLPNGAMKVRIDKYILTSGVDVRSCGRTVGRSHEGILSKSTLKRDFSGKEVGSRLEIDCGLLKNATKKECCRNKKDQKALGQLGLHNGNKEDGMDGVCKKTEKDLTQSHEEKVSESLDNALMETLGGASFTRKNNSHSVTRNKTSLPSASCLVGNLGQKTRPEALNETSTSRESCHPQSQFTSSNCVSCKIPPSALSMFQLPCKHSMCRKCLSDQSKVTKILKCSSCDCEFEQKDVIRVHQ